MCCVCRGLRTDRVKSAYLADLVLTLRHEVFYDSAVEALTHSLSVWFADRSRQQLLVALVALRAQEWPEPIV